MTLEYVEDLNLNLNLNEPLEQSKIRNKENVKRKTWFDVDQVCIYRKKK